MIPTNQRKQQSKNEFIMYPQEFLPSPLPPLNNDNNHHLQQQKVRQHTNQPVHSLSPSSTLNTRTPNQLYSSASKVIADDGGGLSQQHLYLKNNNHSVNSNENKRNMSNSSTSVIDNHSLSTFYQQGGIEMYQPSPSSLINQPPQQHNCNTNQQNNNRIYSFMPLESVFQQKRPRRKFNEIERLYSCNYLNCIKAYGTLNHLNAHISMQEHGPKRLPVEFKELRKQLRKSKAEMTAKNRNSITSAGSNATSSSTSFNNNHSMTSTALDDNNKYLSNRKRPEAIEYNDHNTMMTQQQNYHPQQQHYNILQQNNHNSNYIPPSAPQSQQQEQYAQQQFRIMQHNNNNNQQFH